MNGTLSGASFSGFCISGATARGCAACWLARGVLVVREENVSGVVEAIAGVAEGDLGGVFSRRIGLARREASYSATGG